MAKRVGPEEKVPDVGLDVEAPPNPASAPSDTRAADHTSVKSERAQPSRARRRSSTGRRGSGQLEVIDSLRVADGADQGLDRRRDVTSDDEHSYGSSLADITHRRRRQKLLRQLSLGTPRPSPGGSALRRHSSLLILVLSPHLLNALLPGRRVVDLRIVLLRAVADANVNVVDLGTLR